MLRFSVYVVPAHRRLPSFIFCPEFPFPKIVVREILIFFPVHDDGPGIVDLFPRLLRVGLLRSWTFGSVSRLFRVSTLRCGKFHFPELEPGRLDWLDLLIKKT